MQAGFILRFFAWLLDLMIVAVGELAILFAFIGIETWLKWMNVDPALTASIIKISTYPAYVLFIGFPWLYYAGMESSDKRATYGKFLFEMWVTDMQGGRISFKKATARFFARILSALPLFGGYIMAAFTGKKQALHDILCGTQVVVAGKNIDREGL